MNYKYFVVTIDDASNIATVYINFPPSNGFTLESAQELLAILQLFSTSSINGMILTSTSNSIFSSGVVLDEILTQDTERIRNIIIIIKHIWRLLYNSPYPTAALITGHALGVGCLLALSCEYRVLLDKFTLGMNETAVGFFTPVWFNATLENIIGSRQAELALTSAKSFTADESIEIGLVDEIAKTTAEGYTKALAFIKKFANIHSESRSIAKQLSRKRITKLMENEDDEDVDVFVKHVMQPDVQAHLRMYLTKIKKQSSKL